jgi:thiol-disulfide isomerase/thioredoxin
MQSNRTLVGSNRQDNFIVIGEYISLPNHAYQFLVDVFLLGKKHDETNFVTIDVDEFDSLAAKYRAISIPLFIGFKEGREIGRMSGKDENALKTFIDSHKSA